MQKLGELLISVAVAGLAACGAEARPARLDEAEAGRAAAFLITNAEGAAFHRDRLRARAAEFDPDVPVVVYCWSPGCNAGAKGAVEFAKLGFSVREMIGGYEYWARESYPVEGADGPLPRVFDPLVMYVRP